MVARVGRVLVVALAVGLACAAATAAEVADGAKELQFAFQYADTDQVGSSLDLDGSLGWFLTPRNEVGVIFSYFDFSSDDPLVSDTDGGAGGIFYRWNFKNGSEYLIPYVGAQALWPFGDTSDVIDYSLGAEFGTRFIVGSNASVNVAAFYQEDYGASGFSDTETFGVAAGISIFFGNE
jgi:hypothetical protein